MEYDHQAENERRIRRYNDPELLALWEEAKQKDAADSGVAGEHGLAQHDVMWRLKTGEWWMQKRDRARIPPAASRRSVVGGPSRPDEREAAAYPIGRAVASERVRARMLQRDLADAAGMRRDALSLVERDRRPLSFDEAVRLADALRVPLDRFRPG